MKKHLILKLVDKIGNMKSSEQLVCLFHHLPYLFTFESNQRIPKDSNALEAHFRHINEVCAIHCGLTRVQKQKLINSIVLASSIVPKEEVLQGLFKNGH